MPEIAVIGGTGLSMLKALSVTRRKVVRTPYGEPSSPVTLGHLWNKEIAFLARHGYGHTIPPHRVNYRANLWALKSLGVEKVIAVAAVGGIGDAFPPTRLAIPDQIIDYTWGRAHTFFEEDLTSVTHIDFTYPYCQALRERLIEGCRDAGIDAALEGTYGAVQGPRLETAAEIERMAGDGCHMVGMTGMPEAALARELGLCYATCAVVANWAAGKAGAITMEDIERHLRQGMETLHRLLETVIPRL
ncbi:MAG: S-methyl-5'-thioinosine phosphorylase [Gammaproteobacteria bacterium]|nr:MAG: S-methyl-5'-thioinosine phosphorylase [Gammaproteobacteria bacterium]